MRRLGETIKIPLVIAAYVVIVAGAPGCSREKGEVTVASPFSGNVTFAVAPILNFSGEFDLDPVKTADLLASELSYVEGVAVLPVNRVVAILATQGARQIESPEHALEVARAAGADAILVAGITEYDAYTPVVGLALQMYALPERSPSTVDATVASSQSRPFVPANEDDATLPVGQIQVVYNAAHSNVVEALRRYAKPRSEGENPLGWRRYLKVQMLFLRFCWHDAIERLMDQQRIRQTILAGGNDSEAPL